MIPPFNSTGRLPPGIHPATWAEFEDRFGWNDVRRRLLRGLKRAADSLQRAGCRVLYLDGSFVTAKAAPEDFDGCWDVKGVSPARLDAVLLDFSNGRVKQKIKFGGELFPASDIADRNTLQVYLDFFQTDKEDGTAKGIVALKLGGSS